MERCERICRQQREEVKSGGLTLNEPSSPDCIVQTDLISPQQPQTLKRLPLGRDYLTTAKKKEIIVFWLFCSAFSLCWNKWGTVRQKIMGTVEITLAASPPPPCKKSVLILTNSSQSAYSPVHCHAVDTFCQCPSACWVLRRGPLMWGAQRVARKPGGGHFQHAFNGVASLQVTHSKTTKKAYYWGEKNQKKTIWRRTN